ncbi:hypothetical protein D5Q72_14555 [Enterococcus faecalis]|nr:hypothetical protein [Enterococcus faecalis]EGO8615121.1 hypothetical protein [Enterococcus faecalis]EGO8911395.1 hypothetical protein [Enterococcus faecalis]EGO9796766.1 hypothetical protein [Enterococcus faecalis]MBO6371776.1 hypothetical protein [Enterococcus faecalis]
MFYLIMQGANPCQQVGFTVNDPATS